MKENKDNININKGNEHSEGVQNNNKIRYWLDLDGTCCYYPIELSGNWWENEGVFISMRPQEKVIKAVKRLIKNGADVYILSAYNKDFPFAKEEKIQWVAKYLPEIPLEKQIYTIVGENKADFIPGGVRPTDVLLDDYTKNLENWAFENNGIAIKLLNGINHKKSWNGVSVRANGTIKDIVNVLTNIQNALEEE